MVWFRKLFPIFFKKAPDGTFHWFFIDWCVLESTSNYERCYYFKLNKVFLWEINVEGLINKQISKYEHESHQLYKEIDKLNHTVDAKDEERRWVSRLKTDVDIECNKISGELERVSGEKLELEKDLSVANTKVIEKDKKIRSVNIEKARVIGNLQAEIDKRDGIIGEFKEFTHKERVNFRTQQIEDLQLYNDNMEKLRKELEMLDKDFVDVAKAMRLYRTDKDRPVKGFRIGK